MNKQNYTIRQYNKNIQNINLTGNHFCLVYQSATKFLYSTLLYCTLTVDGYSLPPSLPPSILLFLSSISLSLSSSPPLSFTLSLSLCLSLFISHNHYHSLPLSDTHSLLPSTAPPVVFVFVCSITASQDVRKESTR